MAINLKKNKDKNKAKVSKEQKAVNAALAAVKGAKGAKAKAAAGVKLKAARAALATSKKPSTAKKPKVAPKKPPKRIPSMAALKPKRPGTIGTKPGEAPKISAKERGSSAAKASTARALKKKAGRRGEIVTIDEDSKGVSIKHKGRDNEDGTISGTRSMLYHPHKAA